MARPIRYRVVDDPVVKSRQALLLESPYPLANNKQGDNPQVILRPQVRQEEFEDGSHGRTLYVATRHSRRMTAESSALFVEVVDKLVNNAARSMGVDVVHSVQTDDIHMIPALEARGFKHRGPFFTRPLYRSSGNRVASALKGAVRAVLRSSHDNMHTFVNEYRPTERLGINAGNAQKLQRLLEQVARENWRRETSLT